jgi:hypothetical protein
MARTARVRLPGGPHGVAENLLGTDDRLPPNFGRLEAGPCTAPLSPVPRPSGASPCPTPCAGLLTEPTTVQVQARAQLANQDAITRHTHTPAAADRLGCARCTYRRMPCPCGRPCSTRLHWARSLRARRSPVTAPGSQAPTPRTSRSLSACRRASALCPVGLNTLQGHMLVRADRVWSMDLRASPFSDRSTRTLARAGGPSTAVVFHHDPNRVDAPPAARWGLRSTLASRLQGLVAVGPSSCGQRRKSELRPLATSRHSQIVDRSSGRPSRTVASRARARARRDRAPRTASREKKKRTEFAFSCSGCFTGTGLEAGARAVPLGGAHSSCGQRRKSELRPLAVPRREHAGAAASNAGQLPWP